MSGSAVAIRWGSGYCVFARPWAAFGEVGSPVSGGFPRPVARVVPHHRGLPQISFVEGPYPQCVWAGGYTRSARLTLSALPVQRSRAGCEMPFLPSPFSGLVQHPLGWILAGWSYFSLSASQAWQPGSTWVTLRPHWCSPSRDLGSDSIFLAMGYGVQHRRCCTQGRLLAAALFVCPPALHGVVAGPSLPVPFMGHLYDDFELC